MIYRYHPLSYFRPIVKIKFKGLRVSIECLQVPSDMVMVKVSISDYLDYETIMQIKNVVAGGAKWKKL